MKKLLSIAAAFFTACAFVHADTSYLLVQGPFGSGGSTLTYQWKVTYDHGVLVTGQDLLTAVFGPTSLTGDYSDGFGGNYPEYTSGDGTQGVNYITFPGGSFFSIAFTLNSTTVMQDSFYDPGWNYYVTGGSGPFHGGAYDNSGSWTYSDDGQSARLLSDGSYDAWVYGATFPAAPVAGENNAPTSSNFSSATLVVVPEPGSIAMLAIGGAGLLLWRKKIRS